MILSPEAHEAFKAHVIAQYPKEACGLLIDGVYVPQDNISETPERTFRIAPEALIRSGSMDLQAVLHSHPYDLRVAPAYPPEWPSTADMRSWIAMGIPWGICATEGEGITQLVWLDDANPAPLLGREFIHGVHDCYSIVRDWFKLQRSVTLPNFARGMDWWETGADLYDENFERAGFVTIPFEEATVGDCVLFKVRSPVTNHAAVITGENEILHHLFHRLSGHDSLNKWTRVINRAVRYRGP